MLLMIDNYDSFTYNLVQYFGELKEKVKVFRNDKITISEIQKMNPDKIVISPGPGRPESAGISKEIISIFKGKFPILGVCLGHQCIGEVFGADIIRAKRIMHGKTSKIDHDNSKLFKNIPLGFEATRYHSLIINRENIPDCFKISAWTDQNEIMGVSHKKYLIEGIQFHPESILTGQGKEILNNFLQLATDFWENKL
jgi:anthranilate synthase/aminodeoxychorismate synthase-like glutamine amidotransferase